MHVFANFTSPKSRIALRVARKIAPCDRAFISRHENISCTYIGQDWLKIPVGLIAQLEI